MVSGWAEFVQHRREMLWSVLRILVVGLVGVGGPVAVLAEPVASLDQFPGREWGRVEPQAAGWSTDGIATARAWSETIGSTAVMIVQHGLVVAEWGDRARRSNLYSVRKSLLNALIGIAVDERRIALDATMAQLGIDDTNPTLTDEERTATVADLLAARSGIYHLALYEDPGMVARRPPRGSHPPGTFWYYNNWDFNALGTIYERAVGMSIFDAFERRIATPIGMQDYQASDGHYVTGAASIHAAYPIRMSARDLARFALLYLRDGRWNDRQVVPSEWVSVSTRAHSDTGFGPGYGYLWWTGAETNVVTVPPGTFFAHGNQGQSAVVIPSLDLIVVHRIDSSVEHNDPTEKQKDRLLWLILSAGGVRDIGPDALVDARPRKPR
jgi:CubicO group peptidase (beta-lactamase class C family)